MPRFSSNTKIADRNTDNKAMAGDDTTFPACADTSPDNKAMAGDDSVGTSADTNSNNEGGRSTEPINLVLFGKVGNGKSALGNSIIGNGVFDSKVGCAGVTTICQIETTKLDDGQVVNVIDTPGIFDPKEKSENLRKEIVRCVDMSKGGIHGLLLVFSIRNRFTDDEGNAIKCMQEFFGESITKYMVVVFTGGDELGNRTTLEDYLCGCSQSFKDLIGLCGHRVVVFDNKTTDTNTRKEQVMQLMYVVKKALAGCDGKAYTNEIFEEMKKQARLRPTGQEKDYESMQKNYEERYCKLIESIELKLNDATIRFHEELQRERAARERAEIEVTEERRRAFEENSKMLDRLTGMMDRNAQGDERREKERREDEFRQHERSELERAQRERLEFERIESNRVMLEKVFGAMERNANARADEERRHRERIESQRGSCTIS